MSTTDDDDLPQLIRGAAALEGSAYMEFLPGRYRGTCWNPASLYTTEETFGYLEPILERHVARYDHFAFNEIAVSEWPPVLEDWLHLAKLLDHVTLVSLPPDLGFIFGGTRDRFVAHLEQNSRALQCVIRDLSAWIFDQSKHHSSISILGI